MESLAGERIEEHRVLAGDLADTHAKLNALVRAGGDERQRAEEARALLADLRQELAQLRSTGQPRRAAVAARCRPTPWQPSSG